MLEEKVGKTRSCKEERVFEGKVGGERILKQERVLIEREGR